MNRIWVRSLILVIITIIILILLIVVPIAPTLPLATPLPVDPNSVVAGPISLPPPLSSSNTTTTTTKATAAAIGAVAANGTSLTGATLLANSTNNNNNNTTTTISLTTNATTTTQENSTPLTTTPTIASTTTYSTLPTNSSSNLEDNSTTTTTTNTTTFVFDSKNNQTVKQSSMSNNDTTSKYFDIDYASQTFQDSMADKNAISLNHYLNGFKELMKFFHSLGTIFLFVTSDLETKIGLLEGYRNTEKGAFNPAYLTIQSAIEYETKENLLRDAKRQSGARTILRLHRALEFLSALMLNLSKLEEDAETVPAAREAYSNTLARHHPWTIRTIASFAMRTLPHKKLLVESVLGKEKSGNETATNEKMLMLANVTENLFNVVDKYYEENNIKDLP